MHLKAKTEAFASQYRSIRGADELGRLRIALVKQDVYQDLYVAPPHTSDAGQLLSSSIMRVGPVGLFTKCESSFFIVDELSESECQIYREVIPALVPNLPLLRTMPANELPGHDFLQPGSQVPQGEYSVDPEGVDWSKFDIVISINVSLSTRLVDQHPRTLFAYMIGEANLASKRVGFGYDVALNQMTRGRISRKGVVDFPYTFVGPHCLESLIAKHLGRVAENEGIYVEINSCPERPVRVVPEPFRQLESLGHRMRLHRQNVMDNLSEVYDSKYFVKIGGRGIRGNSVIEAISAGTLVLMDPNECTHHELLPRATRIRNANEAVALIGELDANPQKYADLQRQQRSLLSRYVLEAPLESLHRCLEFKRARSKSLAAA